MNELLRKIPKVDELLKTDALAQAAAQYGAGAVTEAIRVEQPFRPSAPQPKHRR